MPPAARISDMHVCPMVTPGVPPIPHVGGPILPPGTPTVLIGGLPAACMGDMCVCTGPPDSIVKGSTGVLIGGKPAARMGDTTAHGGSIVMGCFTVLIGEAGGGGGGGGSVTPVNVMMEMMQSMSGAAQQEMAQRAALTEAAGNGTPFCEECEQARQQQQAEAAPAPAPAEEPAPAAEEEEPTATLTSQTRARYPEDRARTKIGVGEEVEITYHDGTADWTIEGEGRLSTTNGGSTTLRAFDSAGSITVTGNGPQGSASITFEVVRPSSWKMRRKNGTNKIHTQNMPNGGWLGDVFLAPNDVNFYNVQVRELDDQFTGTGPYNTARFNNQFHGRYPAPDQASPWIPLELWHPTHGTHFGSGPRDRIYSGLPEAYDTPGEVAAAAGVFTTGTLTTRIRWQWRVAGRSAHNLSQSQQQHTLAANGSVTSAKARHTETSNLADPTT